MSSEHPYLSAVNGIVLMGPPIFNVMVKTFDYLVLVYSSEIGELFNVDRNRIKRNS